MSSVTSDGHLTGTQPFGPLNLLTRPPVLIPRPETEEWTLRLADLLKPTRRNPVSILDLCTGSGCIPLLLCRVWPAGSVRAYGVDISRDAIQLARDNARLCNTLVDDGDGTSSAQKRVTLDRNSFTPILADIRHTHFLTIPALHPPFDVITSNPPYIPLEDYKNLSPSVKDWEDPRALIGDPVEDPPRDDSKSGRGLSFYGTIADLLGTGRLLAPGGIVALEVGEGQACDVAHLVQTRGSLRDVDIWKDVWGKERTVVAGSASRTS